MAKCEEEIFVVVTILRRACDQYKNFYAPIYIPLVVV